MALTHSTAYKRLAAAVRHLTRSQRYRYGCALIFLALAVSMVIRYGWDGRAGVVAYLSFAGMAVYLGHRPYHYGENIVLGIMTVLGILIAVGH
jgi:hypothetical protein